MAEANNVSTPPAELAQLAEDEDLWVRRAVAEDPATLTQVLEKLAADQDVNIPPPPVIALKRSGWCRDLDGGFLSCRPSL